MSITKGWQRKPNRAEPKPETMIDLTGQRGRAQFDMTRYTTQYDG